MNTTLLNILSALNLEQLKGQTKAFFAKDLNDLSKQIFAWIPISIVDEAIRSIHYCLADTEAGKYYWEDAHQFIGRNPVEINYVSESATYHRLDKEGNPLKDYLNPLLLMATTISVEGITAEILFHFSNDIVTERINNELSKAAGADYKQYGLTINDMVVVNDKAMLNRMHSFWGGDKKLQAVNGKTRVIIDNGDHILTDTINNITCYCHKTGVAPMVRRVHDMMYNFGFDMDAHWKTVWEAIAYECPFWNLPSGFSHCVWSKSFGVAHAIVVVVGSSLDEVEISILSAESTNNIGIEAFLNHWC